MSRILSISFTCNSIVEKLKFCANFRRISRTWRCSNY